MEILVRLSRPSRTTYKRFLEDDESNVPAEGRLVDGRRILYCKDDHWGGSWRLLSNRNWIEREWLDHLHRIFLRSRMLEEVSFRLMGSGKNSGYREDDKTDVDAIEGNKEATEDGNLQR